MTQIEFNVALSNGKCHVDQFILSVEHQSPNFKNSKAKATIPITTKDAITKVSKTKSISFFPQVLAVKMLKLSFWNIL